MPGAFAHFTIVDQLATKGKLKALQLNPEAVNAILLWTKFTELGAVSPDYPYLVLGDASAAHWADTMHYKNTVDIVRLGIKRLKTMHGTTKQKCVAWLMGYIAHIGTDVTIHPIVERIAGPYQASTANQQKHRTCEMNQDIFIWAKYRPNFGRLQVCEYLDHTIGRCSDELEIDKLDQDIRSFWGELLQEVHPIDYQEDPPNIDKWHKWFLKVVDNAEETANPESALFAIARHVLAGKGLLYPAEIDHKFIENLEIPPYAHRTHYLNIFEHALDNVGELWKNLSDDIYENGNYFEDKGNWNLDDGKYINTDKVGQYVFW